MTRIRNNRRATIQRHSRRGSDRLDRGFTLIEMVMVITLVGIIFGFGSVLLGKVFSSYSVKQEIADADWQAKVALERVVRELRAARSATAADLDIAASTQVRFIDTDGNGVCFYYDAAAKRIMRSPNGPTSLCTAGTPQALADNISALSFTYWTSTGGATAVVASVYYITVDMTVADGVYNSRFRTNTRPRNF